MELTSSSCTLNPLATTLLYKHNRLAHRVFSDVIGLHDIDHIALTTVSHQNELTFLSYKPSIEYNLITCGLWAHDLSYHPNFLKKRQCQLWTDLYHKDKYLELIHIKQHKHHLRAGLSTTLHYKHCILLLSFATKSKHPEAEHRLLQTHPELIQMGRYCFQNISHVFMPYLDKAASASNKPRIISPYMRLIVNNNANKCGL